MKKFFLSLGVACMTLSAFASTRILYQQNFENVNSVQETGWTFGGSSYSIVSDSYGKHLELNLGQSNGRSGILIWNNDEGTNIFFDDEGQSLLSDGNYFLQYDFCIQRGSNNQYNSCITVFTNHVPVTNQGYRNPWSPAGWWDNYLFDMSQEYGQPYRFAVNGETETTVDEETGETTYSISFADAKTFSEGTWYTVTLAVNVNDRTVEYMVTDIAGDDIASGTRTVPETDMNGNPISMYADGLYTLLARYNSIFLFDNIKVFCESIANIPYPPTIALSKIDLDKRTYWIHFDGGETLHVEGTEGETFDVNYDECDGDYEYETTTSGELKAWTTCGSATSEVVTVTVDTTPIVLPDVEVKISGISEEYGRTYTLSVENADVPLRPTILIDYQYEGVEGESFGEDNVNSGTKVTVNQRGILTITSHALGYQSKTIRISNDLPYKIKKVYDFARMTEEEVKAAGLPGFDQVLNSSKTSGFDNWTGRKRFYYNLAGSEVENENGSISYTTVYPFGFITADNETNVIHYGILNRDEVEGNNSTSFFEGLSIFPDKGKKDAGLPNIGMMQHIGLFNDETKNNNNNIIIHDLDQTEYVVVNCITSYGGNSNHPVVATDEEYYAQLEGEDTVYSVFTNGIFDEETGTYNLTHPLYRIDTACTKITIFEPKEPIPVSVEEMVAPEVAGDNYYYSIDGVRMVKPTRPGLYIHNGKKIIVK